MKEQISDYELVESSSIEDIVKYIIYAKLKIKELDVDGYIKIFRVNLIPNLAVLCTLSPNDINKLKLPLALETEIKNLIIERNKSSKVSGYSDITDETKGEICRFLNTVIRNNYYRNILFEKFYENWLKSDVTANELVSRRSLDTKSKKLFGTIQLLIGFMHKGNEMIEEIENMIVVHLILKVEDHGIYSETLANTIYQVLDGQMDLKTKEALCLIIKEVGSVITSHYEVIKRGKKYHIYYRKNKKWCKCFCNITHEAIIISSYPDKEMLNRIEIKEINEIEKVDDGDTRLTKQTNYCLRFIMKEDEDKYICTDNLEYINYILNDLKVRMRAYDLLDR